MGPTRQRPGVVAARVAVAAGAFSLCQASLAQGGLPVGTTLQDYFLPGSQPLQPMTPMFDAFQCVLCHGDFDQAEPPLPLDAEPYRNWNGSMMAQATRDPIFWAALTIANQDADFGGDLCLRCHTPAGWLAGRSVPTSGLALLHDTSDFQGVVCHFCHRMVNPTYVPGESPVQDQPILAALDAQGLLPTGPGTAQYVVDPQDRRRGPYDLGPNFFFHAWLQSPFHQQATLCGTCHDVSNPIYTRQIDDTYAMNLLDAPHDTLDQYEMFPIERTFSEWDNSQFASGGVQLDGRFGGNHPTGIMESCQDCHMPDQVSPGCRVPGFAPHPDLAAHFLNGGNTWVIEAVQDLYTDGDVDPVNDPVFFDEATGLTQDIVDDSIARAVQFLRLASDMDLSVVGSNLKVRITNYCGHKLPTGYPEGRRMWINVRFFDGKGGLIQEHGEYDFATATLTTADTKVYESVLGLDAAQADETGLPEGPSFHFILNNSIVLDNRIPPIGFTNSAFEAVQARPVGYSYPDGQHWDDTSYALPVGAAEALVTVYYQNTSREYIEFLRDENATDDRGQIAYDQWVAHGMSPPVDMDSAVIKLAAFPGDIDGDGDVDINDLLDLLAAWGSCGGTCPPSCPEDFDGNCNVGITDLLILLTHWG